MKRLPDIVSWTPRSDHRRIRNGRAVVKQDPPGYITLAWYPDVRATRDNVEIRLDEHTATELATRLLAHAQNLRDGN